MAVDVVLCCIIYIVVLLSQGDPGQMWILPGAKSSLAILGVVYAFVVWRGGTVLNLRNASRWQILYLVLKNVVTTAVICTVLLYVCHIGVMSWRARVLMYALVLAVCSGFRLLMFVLVRYYRLRPGNYDEVVLIGEGDNVTLLYREMANNPQWGYKVTGYFAGTRSSDMEKSGCRYLGGTDGVVDFLKTHTNVSAVFCSAGADTEASVKPLVRHCVNNMVTFYSLPSLGGSVNNRLYFTTIGNVPVLTIYDSPLTNPWRRLAKRTFDIVFSLLFLCTLFLPITLIVTVITKFTMPGPVFFRQKRNGLNGRTFYCLKFRSMKVNNQADVLQATEDDPQVGQVHETHQYRRAAAVHQRPDWRHECRRPASAHAETDGDVFKAHRAVYAAPHGKARHNGVEPGQRLPRRDHRIVADGRQGEARHLVY